MPNWECNRYFAAAKPRAARAEKLPGIRAPEVFNDFQQASFLTGPPWPLGFAGPSSPSEADSGLKRSRDFSCAGVSWPETHLPSSGGLDLADALFGAAAHKMAASAARMAASLNPQRAANV